MSLLNNNRLLVYIVCPADIDEPPKQQANLDRKCAPDFEETIRYFPFLLITISGSTFNASGFPWNIEYKTHLQYQAA